MIAFSLCLLIMVGWFKLMEVMYPPVKPSQNQAMTEPGAPASNSGMAQTEDSASQPSGAVPNIASVPPASNTPAAQWNISSAAESSTVALGDDDASEDNPFEMKVVITPRAPALSQSPFPGIAITSPKIGRTPTKIPTRCSLPSSIPRPIAASSRSS